MAMDIAWQNMAVRLVRMSRWLASRQLGRSLTWKLWRRCNAHVFRFRCIHVHISLKPKTTQTYTCTRILHEPNKPAHVSQVIHKSASRLHKHPNKNDIVAFLGWLATKGNMHQTSIHRYCAMSTVTSIIHPSSPSTALNQLIIPINSFESTLHQCHRRSALLGGS